MGDPNEHKLISGNLCLDFINTKNGHKNSVYNEYINNYNDLIIWSERCGTISSSKSLFLQNESTQFGEDSSKAYQKVIEFRKSLFDVFSSMVQKKIPSKTAIKKIITIQKKGMMASEFVKIKDCFKWTWDLDRSFDSIIWSIAFSATKLLTSKDVKKIRICDGHDCDWFFLDKSRNQMRRWCSMEDCGNRFKMQQRYIRQKKV